MAPDPVHAEHDPNAPAPSRAAILGHPIHPMLIPYPLAFLTTALLTDLAALATGDAFWARASIWLLGAGVVSGLAAGAVGAIDYYGIPRANQLALGKLHAAGNVTALALAAVGWFLRPEGDVAAVPTLALILSILVVAILGVTGWAGGEMSYRHRIGVTERA